MKTPHVNRRRFCRACTLPFLAWWPGQQLCAIDIAESNAAVDFDLRREPSPRSDRAAHPKPQEAR